MRVFIGLELPMSECAPYRVLEKQLQTSFSASQIVASFKKEDQFHITLAFLGNITQDQLAKIDFLEAVAKNFGRPELFIAGMGASPSMDKAIEVFLGVRKDPLLDLLSFDVKEHLRTRGFMVDKRSFMPHVTMASLAAPSNVFSHFGSVQQMFSLFEFQAKRLCVYQSDPGPHGSNYKILQAVKLSSVGESKLNIAGDN